MKITTHVQSGFKSFQIHEVIQVELRCPKLHANLRKLQEKINRNRGNLMLM